MFLKEHPRDPEEYKDSEDPVEYPSFFAWPEWKVFVEKYHIREVRLDLGALGHERRKPTILGANIQYLHRLEGLCDLRRPGDFPDMAVWDRGCPLVALGRHGRSPSRLRSPRESSWSLRDTRR